MLALSALIVSFGCPKPAPAPVKFDLNKPFSLQAGQTGETAEIQGFTIKFDQISSDSRCPRNVQCITAGKADVVLTLSKAGESQTVTLPFTLPNGTSNVTDFKGHTVRVIGVLPFKLKDKEIKPEEYTITLLVSETPPPAPKIKLGEGFILGVGESVVLEDNPMFQVRFDTVTSDSRCPDGTQCIWAGRVDAGFTMTDGTQTHQASLCTGDLSKGGKAETQFGVYTLTFKSVSPIKKITPPILHKDYKAVLSLTK